jgi:Holliday junction resolvasome RuvABC DNA-binding subunit
LVVELRDKLDAFAPSTGSVREPRSSPVLPRNEMFEDAVAALSRLGYTGAEAQTELRRVSEEGGDPSLETMVRRSLALLTRATVPSR